MRPPAIYKSHILHGLRTSDFGQFSLIKVFIIGRFLSSVDGSKLIFY